MFSDLDREELLRLFLAETEEHLALLEQMLVLLETKPDDEETIHAIFRVAHTLKGNASSVGYDGLARLAHAMEDLLDEVRAKRFEVTGALITILLRCGDMFRRTIPTAVVGSSELPSAATHLIETLETAKANGFITETTAAAAASEEHEPQETSGVSARKLRVDLSRLDVILNLTGELSIAAGRLAGSMSILGEREREQLAGSYADVERVLGELQEQVTRVRMVPIGPRFEQQRRTVRDLAHAAGKPARIVIEGRDVEIDASLVEQLKDPLTHLVRNAIDHGVETPAVRAARGKNPIATIALRAYHDGGNVVVEISDDGGGFDRERILERARSLGMLPAGVTPEDDEIYAFVFAPGFTTAETVTEISGRGVGMDVVSRAIATMRGTVRVTSRPNRGATVSLRLPLTLAIVRGLVLDAAGERFVVPVDAITHCAVVPDDERRDITYGLLDISDRLIPYIRLRAFFGIESEQRPRVEQLVVVRSGDSEAALVADDLVGEMQAVIKPLGKVFGKLAGVSSSTIFADGRVGLIADVPALVRSASRASV